MLSSLFGDPIGGLIQSISAARQAGELHDLEMQIAGAAISDYLQTRWDLGMMLKKSRIGFVRAIGYSLVSGALAVGILFQNSERSRKLDLVLSKGFLEAMGKTDFVLIEANRGAATIGDLSAIPAAPAPSKKTLVPVVDDPTAGIEFGG